VFQGLAVRGTGERDPDVGDILLAQPAQQGSFIIYHFFLKSKTEKVCISKTVMTQKQSGMLKSRASGGERAGKASFTSRLESEPRN
jgi:hypothetical protein